MYAGDVAEKRGAVVHRHEWTEEPPGPGAGVEVWVQGQVAPVLDGLPGQPLLIGKSLGCFAAGLAVERSLPAVWLTPVLTASWLTAALERATAPFLLVGGSADPLWDRAAARRLSPYVVEVPAANHGMYVPGPLTDTIAVLARIVVAVEEFLDEVGWP
jgi:hypothetical protein